MRRHSPARFRRGTLLGLVAAFLAGWAATAQAAQWADIATISSTLGNTTGRLCVGGGATGLGCPGYAPQLGASGDVTVTGTLGATRFYGDGSGLTNLNLSGAQVDRIISGTAGIFVSNTGVISFYGASGLSGYFDATGLLVAPSVSLTGANGLSAIKGYFSGNVGVGTSNPSTQLEVMGTVSATAFVGNGAGLTNINASAITMSLDDLSDASASTALGSMYIGSGVGNNAAVTGSLGLGIEALQSNLAGGYRNSALGYQVLKSNTSGLDNTAIGAVAMVSNTTGSNNTALGVGALSQNLSGNGNVALGRGALTRNSTAYYNVGIGYSAAAWMSTGQRNIFMGYNSGFYNTSGNNNLVLGTNAGQGSSGITTYGDSVLLGYRAGVGLTTGASNTFVGSSAGSNHVSGQYNIALGAGAQLPNTTGDYQLNIGNAIYGDLSGADTNRAKIGVNVTSPNANLEVSGTVSATAFVGDGSGLTNINASAVAGLSTDRITSGTAGIFVSDTGIINFRTGGVTTGYLDTSGILITPGISITTANGISSTDGYFRGNVGIGRAPSNTTTNGASVLSVYTDGPNTSSALGNAGIEVWSKNRNANLVLANAAFPYSSSVFFRYGGAENSEGQGQFNFARLATINSGYMRFLISNTEKVRITEMGNVGIGTGEPSSSLHVSGTTRLTSWTMINAGTTPTTPLEVSGTVSATAFVGDGSGLTNINAGALTGLSTDRITSGTAGIFVSDTGIINLRTGGTTTGYFDTSGLLVTPGISATASGISTTNLTVRGTIDVLSGTSNVLVGQFAGASGAGANNTAVGMYASRNNSGSYVLSFGHAAARYNTGTQVLALGYVAAERNTNWYITAVGNSAARDNTGRTITAVGYSTAASNTGNRLTAVGANAAQNNTGSYTTALGLFAAQNNTYDNVTALGYNAQSDKANQVILGDGNVVEVTTTGVILAAGVSTTGVISATAFVGDGSGLTNINASAVSGLSTDRITSGTAGIFVSDTGVINLRTGGTTTGYFDTSGLLVVPGISATGMISTTNLYMQPTYSHPYYGPSSKFAAISIGSDINNSFVIGASGGTTYLGARNNVMEFSTVRENGGAPDDIIFRHANLSSIVTSLILKGSSGWLGIGSGSTMDPSASLHVSGTTRITSWTMLNANAAPTAPLEVSGTVSATYFVGNGSGLTNLPAANLSETISINDLSDASSTYASGNLFMGSYAAGEVTGGTNNTAMGVLALASTTTGGYNTAVGYKAMRSFNGAVLGRNVAVGYRAMHSLTSGLQNVAIGYDALYYNTGGNNNTAIGSAAMANSMGNHNTAVGRNALYNNAFGNENVALGMEIGAATPSPSQYISTSVLIGMRAGYNLGYAQNNVLIGYRSGYTMTNGTNNIVIGTDTTMPYNAAGSYQLNLGNALYGDLSGAAAANARLGINVASPTLALEVSGTVSATLVQVSAKTPPSADCDDATDYGKLGLDPTTFQPRMCLPR